MTSRLAALVAAVLLLGGWSCEDAAENAPAAVEPELVRVAGPGGPVEPVLGHFPVLPGRTVIVHLRLPWPADLEVRLDGRRLERGEAGDAGSFDYEVDAGPAVPEWRVVVSPPPAQRRSRSFTLEFAMVSVNPGHTGADRRSEPLTVHVRDASDRFRFDGRAVLDVDHPELAGPTGREVAFEVEVDPEAGTLALVSFPALVVGPFDTGLGENTTTITRAGGGSGTFDAAGNVELGIELHFEHSHLLAGDSDVGFDLTTGLVGIFERWGRVSGSPVNLETLQVELADVSRFRGGYLDGRRVRLGIRGSFS